MSIEPENWFWILFAVIAGIFVFYIATLGLKGAVFGARIVKSYGAIPQGRTGLARGRIRVHVLETTPQRSIGIEVVSYSFLSWEMIPIKLTADGARRLIDDLSDAIDEA